MGKNGNQNFWQKGSVSLLYFVIILAGLVIGVIVLEGGTRFFSSAWDIIGPSKSAIIKIPVKSPLPSKIATSSAVPATGSAKPKSSASASASIKPKASATASASPR